MADRVFRIKRRAPTPAFLRVWARIRAISLVWAEFIAGVVMVSILFGPIVMLSIMAVLLTFALPILCLTLWGRSLDSELGWRDQGGRR